MAAVEQSPQPSFYPMQEKNWQADDIVPVGYEPLDPDVVMQNEDALSKARNLTMNPMDYIRRLTEAYIGAGGSPKTFTIRIKRKRPNNSAKEHRRWRAKNKVARESRRRNRQ